MKLKYTKSTLSKLENIFKQCEYKVRYEKGQFKSGYCLLHEKKIVVVNKFFDVKGRIDSLIDILIQLNVIENSIEQGIDLSDVIPQNFHLQKTETQTKFLN